MKCPCFVGDRRSSALILLLHPQCISRSSAVFGENRKAVSFLIKTIKLKTLWRYQGCNSTLQVLQINIRFDDTVCYVPFKDYFCCYKIRDSFLVFVLIIQTK